MRYTRVLQASEPTFMACSGGSHCSSSAWRLLPMAAPTCCSQRGREELPWHCAPWLGIVLSCPGPVLLFLCLCETVVCPALLSSLWQCRGPGLSLKAAGGQSVKCGFVSLVASSGRTRVLAATDRLLHSCWWRWDRS